jgi:hypothetical protein
LSCICSSRTANRYILSQTPIKWTAVVALFVRSVWTPRQCDLLIGLPRRFLGAAASSRMVLLSAPSPASSAVPSGPVDAALGSVAFLRSAAAVLWVLRSAPAPTSVPSVSAGAALGSVAGILHRCFQVLFFNPPYFTSLRLCACTILPQHIVLCFIRSSVLCGPRPRRPRRRPCVGVPFAGHGRGSRGTPTLPPESTVHPQIWDGDSTEDSGPAFR